MHLAFLCTSLRGGGTERIVCRLANYLSEAHDVSIITLVSRESFYPLNEEIDVLRPPLGRSHSHGLRPFRVLRQLKHLYFAGKRASPDLCLVFGEDIAGIAILTIRLAGVKRAWAFFRGTPERSLRGLNGVLNPRFCRLADRIFLQTQAGKEALASVYRSEKLVAWPNPIEIPEWASPPEQREPLIMNVGSIGRLKNQAALLRMFGELNIEGGWKLLFIGDGPDRSELEIHVESHRHSQAVTFAGEQRSISADLDRAAIFSFTSLAEGFPNALAEAMAAGCACISYDCPTGPSELIDHGVNGFLVKLGDEAEYTRLLQRLIDEPELRAKFSLNARVSMKRFEAGVVMARLEEMIEEAINKKQAQGTRIKDQGKQ